MKHNEPSAQPAASHSGDHLDVEYKAFVLSLRKTKQLHTTIETRLAEIVGKITADLHPVKEIQGLAGGRNDLMLFEFNGRKVLFELFATKSQVSRDLRILDNTDAHIKIGIIIDKEADAGVFGRFLKENPENNYPFLFCKEILQQECHEITKCKLREIIFGEQEAIFRRQLLQKIAADNFYEVCAREGIQLLSKAAVRSGTFTMKQVIVTYVLHKLLGIGTKRNQLKELGRYLLQDHQIEQVWMKIDAGFSVFLYSDLKSNFDLVIASDLLDWIRAGDEFSQPFILLSMNAVIHEALTTFRKQPDKEFPLKHDIVFQLGMSTIADTANGMKVSLSLPNNTVSIDVFAPINGDPCVSDDEYLRMVKIHRQ